MPTDKEIIMKANELRIGNYVTFNNFIQPEKIVIVDGRFLLPFNKTDSEINNYYQPIPLTEEWLFKLGFEKINDFNYSFDDFMYLSVEDEDWEDLCMDVHIKNADVGIIYLTALECVHHLQNLYFSLTNTELVCQ